MSAHIDIRHDELLASLDTANEFVDSKIFPVMLFQESTYSRSGRNAGMQTHFRNAREPRVCGQFASLSPK